MKRRESPVKGQWGKEYKNWAQTVRRRVARNENWKRVGTWMYPTRENGRWAELFYHICRTNFDLENTPDGVKMTDDCCACGEKVPDGLKMVVLLTEKL